MYTCIEGIIPSILEDFITPNESDEEVLDNLKARVEYYTRLKNRLEESIVSLNKDIKEFEDKASKEEELKKSNEAIFKCAMTNGVSKACELFNVDKSVVLKIMKEKFNED